MDQQSLRLLGWALLQTLVGIFEEIGSLFDQLLVADHGAISRHIEIWPADEVVVLQFEHLSVIFPCAAYL